MKNVLEISIRTERIPLSRASVQALRNLDRYDFVVFTSKNAKQCFAQELKERRIILPRGVRVIQVGPRNDLLKLSFTRKRLLFPRSVLAPHDIVRRLRGRGAVVRVMPLYTAHGVPLTRAQRAALLQGAFSAVSFRSPSGVIGLLRQFRGAEKAVVLGVPARCIGRTTAAAAKAAGFRRISVEAVL